VPDFPTWTDLNRIARDEVLSRNPKLSLDAADREGSDLNIILAAGAAIGDEVVGQLADVAAGQFLDSAEGDALDHLVFDRYGLTRKQASPSYGTVEFLTYSANPGAFSIPAGTLVTTPDGVQLSTLIAATFPAGLVGPVLVAVRSVVAGATQQAKAGSVNAIVTIPPGAPSNLYVRNALATAGASDAESDSALRDRARRFWTTVRRGTLAALEQGALNVLGVTAATAIEVLDSSGRPNRMVQLIITDPFTTALIQAGVNPPAYQAQSQQLALSVFNSLSDVRAAGIYVEVIVAQVVLQPITLQLRFQAGANADLVALVARAVVASVVNSLRPGETMSVAALATALKAVEGLQWFGDEISSPVGDVIPASLQVIRTSMDLVQASAVQTGQAQSSTLSTGTANPDRYIIYPSYTGYLKPLAP
jgi:uncharacterized phage protein gp47/JayE